MRVGLIGAGDISQYHLTAWARVADARVVAIANRTMARAARRAAEFDISSTYDDAEQMLVREDLDAVDIVTTRETHATFVLLAAAHGAHVMCQKPLAPTLREAEALVADLGDRVRVMVHENRRFAPHFRTIHRWIAEGRIGEPRQALITTYRSSMIRDSDGRRRLVERASYFASERRLLVGESLIHQLDVARFLLGPLRVVAARALRTEPDIPGETVATLLLETVPSGIPVVISGSYVAPGFGAPSAGAAVGAQASDRLELIGSLASLILTDDALELRGDVHERVPVDVASTYQECFDAAVRHFVDRLRSGDPFESSPADNLETLRLVEDAYALVGEH